MDRRCLLSEREVAGVGVELLPLSSSSSSWSNERDDDDDAVHVEQRYALRFFPSLSSRPMHAPWNHSSQASHMIMNEPSSVSLHLQ